MNSITIYACKSTRKNAKCIDKSYYTYTDTTGTRPRLKTKFGDNRQDLIQWLDNVPYDKYNNFQVVVYSDNVCLRSWTKYYLSSYQVARLVTRFMDLFDSEVTPK